MKRRRFIELIGGALTAPLAAFAQSARSLPRVGFVLNSAPLSTMEGAEPAETVMRGFLHGLRALGYTEGTNIVIERRTAEGKLERLDGLIRGLANAPVDVIVVTGTPMTLAAQKVTTTVPIVFAGMGTPVELGVVQSLAQPGGNITGLVPVFGVELSVKLLEFMREMVPKARRIAYFSPQTEWPSEEGEFRKVAKQTGMTMVFVDAQLPRIEAGLEQLERERADAMFIPPSSSLFVHRNAIVNLARRVRVPDFHGFYQAVEAGALASYGHDSYDLFRRAAGYVDRILKGAKPADMPVEQMDRYALVLNLKTARALGLKIPQTVLIRADRVIE